MSLDPQVRQKIDQLVSSDPVVLFMKGTRSFPQCGFSASVVNILNTLIPKYTTVNVLTDQDVRTGMKDYSDWPTFPQLFIRGEFVGGADIVRQMHEAGELEKKLGALVQAAKPPGVTITTRAAQELQAALKESVDGDVIHITIQPSWEHALDLGPSEPGHVTVKVGALTLQLDRGSAAKADGLVIDFIEDAGGAGFKIENLNRPAAVRQIEPRAFAELLTTGKVKELYDVRTPKERDIVHLPQSKLLDDAAMAKIETLPKDTPLGFMCHHGGRSKAAAEHFLKLGFTNVYNVTGGIDAWARDVDPKLPRY